MSNYICYVDYIPTRNINYTLQKTLSTMSIDEFAFYQKKLEQYNYLVDYGNADADAPEAKALKIMLEKVGLL